MVISCTLPGIKTAGFIGAGDIMAGDNYGFFFSKKRFIFYDNDVIRNNLAVINMAFFFFEKAPNYPRRFNPR